MNRRININRLNECILKNGHYFAVADTLLFWGSLFAIDGFASILCCHKNGLFAVLCSSLVYSVVFVFAFYIEKKKRMPLPERTEFDIVLQMAYYLLIMIMTSIRCNNNWVVNETNRFHLQ